MMPATKAIQQTMFEQKAQHPILWILTQKWSQLLQVQMILVPLNYISFRLMIEYRIISLYSFIHFPRERSSH